MDTEERFVAKNDYREALNVRIATSDEGNEGIVENIRSNRKIQNISLTGDETCIGAYEDLNTGSVIYFLHSRSNNHGIYRVTSAGAVDVILQHAILNFSTNHLITGINIVGDDEDVFPEGLLYWTDDRNPPRKLNILKARLWNSGSGSSLAYGAMDKQTLDVIKYPPTHHPVIGQGGSFPYRTDTSKPSNQLIEKAWQFKYRYVYDDLEKSAWSPISTCAMDASFSAVYSTGVDAQKNNVLPVLFNTGHHTVERIQLAARNSNGSTDFILIADIDKRKVNELVSNMGLPPSFDGDADLVRASVATGAPNEIILDETLPNNVTRFFFFYNDSVYSTIDVVESDKLYDDVPHLAKAQEVVDGNRMVYGNVVTGQTVDETMDVSLNAVVPKEPLLDLDVFSKTNPIQHRVSTYWGWEHGAYNKWRYNKVKFEMEMKIDTPPAVLGVVSTYRISIPSFMIQHALVSGYTTGGGSGGVIYGFGGTVGVLLMFHIEYNHTTAETDPNVIAADMCSELNSQWNDSTNTDVGIDQDLGIIICKTSMQATTSLFSYSGSTIKLTIQTNKSDTDRVWRPKTNYGIRTQKIGKGVGFSNDASDNSNNWKGWLYDNWHPLTEPSAVNQWASGGLPGGNATRMAGLQVASGLMYMTGMSTDGTQCIHPTNNTGGYNYTHSNSKANMSFWGIDTNAGTPPIGPVSFPPGTKFLRTYMSHKKDGDWPDYVDDAQTDGNVPDGYISTNQGWFQLDDSVYDAIEAIINNTSYLPPVGVLMESVAPTAESASAVVGSFKTGARHRFGIVYYDEANRSSSVQLPLITSIYIPRATDAETMYNNIFYDDGTPAWLSYVDSNGITVPSLNTTGYFGEWNIKWEINHNPPDWATRYQWVYGGNTLTDDFVHFVTDGFFSGKCGIYTDTGKTVNDGNDKNRIIAEEGYEDNILVDITNIRQHQKAQGSHIAFRYDWKEGDILRFVKDDTLAVETPAINEPYEFKVLGVVGEREFPRILNSDEGALLPGGGSVSPIFEEREFIVLSRETILVTGPTPVDDSGPIPVFSNYLLEIYSPKKKTDEDKSLYYEFGHVGRIGTDVNGKKVHLRMDVSYQSQIAGIQPATGIFTHGDSYLFNRSSYSDKVFVIVESFHFNDKFKSNYWDKGRPNAVLEDFKRARKHSTCLYSDPYIPNTNINGLNSFYPDVTFAEFERNYNSIQKLYSKDNKLIIFQEDKVSQSLVKRDIIYNVDGSGNVATTDSVLSQSVPYLGKWGINKNPESFAAHGNRMYFADIKRGAVLRLSQDGFSQISSNKMQEYFTDKFESVKKTHISTGEGRHHSVLGVYDIRFREYIVSCSPIWEYGLAQDKWGNWVLVRQDIVEQPFTIGFSEVNKRWNSFYSYTPDMMCSRRSGIVTFLEGDVYVHNNNYAGYNTFYGVEYPSELKVVSNDVPSNNKIYKAFSEEADDVWDVTFRTPNGQETNLVASDFDKRENIYYSDIFNDVNSPGGIIEGDRIRDASLVAKLSISTTEFTRLFGVNFNIVPSHRSNK